MKNITDGSFKFSYVSGSSGSVRQQTPTEFFLLNGTISYSYGGVVSGLPRMPYNYYPRNVLDWFVWHVYNTRLSLAIDPLTLSCSFCCLMSTCRRPTEASIVTPGSEGASIQTMDTSSERNGALPLYVARFFFNNSGFFPLFLRKIGNFPV